MWKQASVASVLLIGVAWGSYALVPRSTVQSVSSDGQTTSPAAAARKWRQEHGYPDVVARSERRKLRTLERP